MKCAHLSHTIPERAENPRRLQEVSSVSRKNDSTKLALVFSSDYPPPNLCLMTPSLEHDYIGLLEASAAHSATMETSKRLSQQGGGCLVGSLKEMEMRLGLPGSESSERKEEGLLTLGLLKKSGSFATIGAKRCFSDAIDGCTEWGFSGDNGSKVEMGKSSGGLFSPVGDNGGRASNAMKDTGLVVKAAVIGIKKARLLLEGTTVQWHLQQRHRWLVGHRSEATGRTLWLPTHLKIMIMPKKNRVRVVYMSRLAWMVLLILGKST